MPVKFTRVDKCPTCGGRVKRSYTDIFFPYCGYTCKRVVQRKEEEYEKNKILKQQKLIEDSENRYREKCERERLKNEKNLRIQEVRDRIAQCESEYQKNSKEAENLLMKCEKRRRAKERAKNWYEKMIKAEIELAILQRGEELNDPVRQTNSRHD